jgi:predicted phage-related endonuclease
MKIHKFENEIDWKAFRRGKITGSRLKDIVAKKNGSKKIGFYELIAERLGIPADEENAMERGHRLEGEAVERFESKTGMKVSRDLVIWEREDIEGVAVSPDGWIGKKEAIEIKCLGSARHIEAVITNEVPDEYHYQKLQYFIVNDKIETLHFCFYDPRLKHKDFHVIEVTRKQVQEEVEAMIAYQKDTLAEVDKYVQELSEF